jgi:hypothetical protein
MTAGTIPVTVTPQAAARVAALGMDAELQRMLEHTRRVVPGLRSIEVREALPYDTGDETTVVIDAIRDNPHLPDDPTERAWGDWQCATFPPEVCQHFVLLCVYGPNHAG